MDKILDVIKKFKWNIIIGLLIISIIINIILIFSKFTLIFAQNQQQTQTAKMESTITTEVYTIFDSKNITFILNSESLVGNKRIEYRCIKLLESELTNYVNTLDFFAFLTMHVVPIGSNFYVIYGVPTSKEITNVISNSTLVTNFTESTNYNTNYFTLQKITEPIKQNKDSIFSLEYLWNKLTNRRIK